MERGNCAGFSVGIVKEKRSEVGRSLEWTGRHALGPGKMDRATSSGKRGRKKTGPKAGFHTACCKRRSRAARNQKRWIRPTPTPIWFWFEPALTPSPIEVVALMTEPSLSVLPLACWYASTAYRPVRFDRL